MSDRPAVELVELTKQFESFTAVKQVSLRVETGEIFGFLGANGAGKTTVMKMLCGLLPPTSGTGTVAGFDIKTERMKIRRVIGYMSQKFSLYPDLTGRENMRFYGAAYDLAPERLARRIAEVTEQLSLAEFLDRQASTLPTGWRQRLALGVALLQEPHILFLDEPTGGVDPVYRRLFWSVLYELAASGTTVFVTTHYMDEAEYCGRISIMDKGKLIAVGSPSALKAQYHQHNLEDLFIDLIRTDASVTASN